MTFPRTFRWGLIVVMVLGPGGTARGLFGQTRPAPRPANPGPLVDSTHNILQVEDVPLKGDAAVFGDPSKPGMYVLRKKLTANQTARPHFDDQDRWITVLKGTLWIGKGDVYRPDALLPIREGGLAYIPANTHYFEMAGDADVVLQITGVGPVKSTHTEVNAKGAPVPEGGPYPATVAAKRFNMPVDPDLLDADQQDQIERAAAAARAKPKTTAPAVETKK